MGGLVDVAEGVGGDERVELRRRDARVAEQLLHDPDVGAAREQVGREGVPEAVRRQFDAEFGALGGGPDDEPRVLPD